MTSQPVSTIALAPRPLLEMLHDQLPHSVAIFDAGLRLVYANPCWRELIPDTGAEPGAPLADLLPGADDLLAAAGRSVREGEAVHIPERPFGETAQDITLAPLTDEGAVIGLKCVMHDATARVRGRQAAAAQERLAAFRLDISQALASSGEVGAVLQACAEAMVRHADAAFARIWVLEEAEDIYRLRASAGMYTRLNGTYSRIPADWIRQKIFGGYSAQVQLDILKTHNVREPEWAAANGLVAWANHPLMVSGRIIGFMSMFARQNFSPDILDELGAVSDAIAQFLERANAETALREREMLFRSVFEAAADGLLITDLETGRILEANPVICAMQGCSHDELCRMHRADLVHPESHAKLATYLTEIQNGRPARVQVTGVRKDGSTYPASAQGSPILYEGQPA
ncbi:MAG: PAS domain S-box protein, partial [Chloroflexota bacterium]|nr:PAS domain S-box protein [Chloroflexota bacterium]